MNYKITIQPDQQAVLLYNSSRDSWDDKTESISAIYNARYHGKSTGYDIYFRSGDKKFFYKTENVQILSKTKEIDIQKQDVYVDDKRVTAVHVDAFKQGYFKVYTSERNYFSKQVSFKSNNYRDIYSYFKKLAEYAAGVAEENSPLSFLSQSYLRLDKEVPNTVLLDYLQGIVRLLPHKERLILPFDFNQSQAKAITAALQCNISVIEGPPGTGKTQTILNLIANILYEGKNCAVISNNNTAVENVYEKLEEEGLAFLAATLGNRTNVTQFFENDREALLTAFLEQQPTSLTEKDLKRMDALSQTVRSIQDMEVETAILESQLIELKQETRYYELVTENSILSLKGGLSSAVYMALMQRLQEPRKLWFFERWLMAYRLRLKRWNADIYLLIRSIEQLYYTSRTRELTQQIESNKYYLKQQNKEQVTKELQELYRNFFEQHVYQHYSNRPVKTFAADDYKYDYNGFLQRYPVVLSTSQSLLNNAPRGFCFDYLIIDEASQGDLLSSTLAMSCARNLVVVGDSRQLQQIDEEMLFEQSELLANACEVAEAYRYSSNSILKSVKSALKTVPTTLLKEHYRCAPDIINFCNKMFYNGELVAMTQNEGEHLQILKTVEGNHARSNPTGSGLYNQREIDEIANLLHKNSSKSVGIISPFRYQANLLTQQFASDVVEADTIHKFQGRQKEEVILSFVVNSLDQDPNKEKSRLHNFVTNEKLLNVAISRGRKKVTAIVADKVYHSENNIINDFIKYTEYLYGTEATKESTVTSVFDMLYSEHSNALLEKYKSRPQEHKTELLMCELINELLADYCYISFSMHTRLGSLVQVPNSFTEEEKKYILHPWAHVDFLFYNKVSKEKLFVLEVDGVKYHEQDKKQAEHDWIKDKVLEANQIPVYRFKTNQSNEKQRLNEILKGFLH